MLGLDGGEYSIPGSSGGQPVLLVFFKTSCATCDLAFPYLNSIRDAYPEGWRLWAVSQDPPGRSADYGRRFAMKYPILLDAPDYAASLLYDPPATPTLFLVGPEGYVQYATHGFAKDDINEVARRIAAHTGAEPRVIAPESDGRPSFKPG